MERSEHRGVRRHRTEQVLTETQVFDVRACLATTGQHQCGLDQHLAPVVERNTASRPGNASGQRITEPQPVGERPKRVQADVSHDPGPTGFHLHATSAGTVHLRSALLCGSAAVSTTTVSPTGRAFPRTCADQVKWRRE